MKEIIDIVHKSIYPFFDVCENEEEPLSDRDKLLLKVNKAICNNLKALEREPCGDAISRQAVLDTMSELNAISFYEAQEDSKECYYEIRQAVENMQPVTPHPNTGKWMKSQDSYGNNHFTCPFCEHDIATKADTLGDNYCSNCGAKLHESEEK